MESIFGEAVSGCSTVLAGRLSEACWTGRTETIHEPKEVQFGVRQHDDRSSISGFRIKGGTIVHYTDGYGLCDEDISLIRDNTRLSLR